MYLSYYEGSCDDLSIADVLWERLSEFGIGIMNYKSEYSYMNLEHGPYSREVYGFQQEQEDPDWIQVRDRVAEMSSYGAVVGFEQRIKRGIVSSIGPMLSLMSGMKMEALMSMIRKLLCLKL